ncbi:hypothetical protein BREVNS_2385 [Brevinematales bacterium NS]|nr:hypothetical protein BREVNS_2385 [Brevinematales bacterium NS]
MCRFNFGYVKSFGLVVIPLINVSVELSLREKEKPLFGRFLEGKKFV